MPPLSLSYAMTDCLNQHGCGPNEIQDNVSPLVWVLTFGMIFHFCIFIVNNTMGMMVPAAAFSLPVRTFLVLSAALLHNQLITDFFL